MAKISSIAELNKKREELQAAAKAKAGKPLVNVSLATCSIASGGKEVLDAMKAEAAAQGLAVEFMQSGCMTYCHSEPTVEITLPGKEPVVFGKVNAEKAKALVEKYIKTGEMVDGVKVIPVGYERVVF
ncbi:MAG: (2Fe-2S) ferredoxin domain-containing protein [Syntrophotaleaceae bacterium]